MEYCNVILVMLDSAYKSYLVTGETQYEVGMKAEELMCKLANKVYSEDNYTADNIMHFEDVSYIEITGGSVCMVWPEIISETEPLETLTLK